MPILGEEPDIFPATLLVEPSSDPWWVVYTRSRQEKQLMRKLRGVQVGHYCPLIARRSRSPAGRVRTSYLPLFTNYLFVQAPSELRIKVLETNCVSRILDVTDPSLLIHDLQQIHNLILTGAAVSPEDRIEAGTRIRVKSGPFKGYEGYVVQRHGKTTLIVDVRFMNQGASVEIEDCQLEPIG